MRSRPYTAEQAVANARSSIPQVSTMQKADEEKLKELTSRRETMLKASNDAWKLVVEYV